MRNILLYSKCGTQDLILNVSVIGAIHFVANIICNKQYAIFLSIPLAVSITLATGILLNEVFF